MIVVSSEATTEVKQEEVKLIKIVLQNARKKNQRFLQIMQRKEFVSQRVYFAYGF